MTSMSTIAERWAQRGLDPSLRERNSRSSNVIASGDSIYSYGRHFEMGRILRDANGIARCVLLNGDRYSSSTTQHQSLVRQVCRHRMPTVPCLIVPFPALDAAGIEYDSIVPLDVRPEGAQYHLQRAATPPTSAVRVRAAVVHYGDDYSDSGYRRIWNAYDQAGKPGNWDDWEGQYEDVLAMPGTHQAVTQREDGQWEWYTVQHWLGDAVFSARSNGRRKRVKFLSSFDRNERERLYFLCELPPCRAVTFEDALQALKPDAVVLAEGMGRTCSRQGDIFGVPMPGLTLAQLKAQGGTLARRSDAAKGVHAMARASAMLQRLVQAEDVRFRTPDYIVHRENMRHSTFGNIPWGRPRAEPIDGRWGRANGETGLRAAAVGRHRDARWRTILQERAEHVVASAIDPAAISLIGTAHTATHVVTMPDGSQYARGTMYHDPALMGENRERDHARCKMGDGKTWHLVQKNTVPISTTRSGMSRDLTRR